MRNIGQCPNLKSSGALSLDANAETFGASRKMPTFDPWTQMPNRYAYNRARDNEHRLEMA
jgi:hypothetical protein